MRELTNRQYKAMIKCISTEDNDILEIFIDNLLGDLLYEETLDIKSLTNIDKLYMLLCVRSYCIGTTAVFHMKVNTDDMSGDEKHEQKKAQVEMAINMNEVLNRLGNYPIHHKFTFCESGLTVNGTLPKKMYYNDVIDVAVDTLVNVQFENKTINLLDVPNNQRKKILYSLPSSILPKIINFLEEQGKLIKDDPIIKFRAPTKAKLPFDDKVELHMYNGSIGETIKLLFGTSLKELYNTDYMLMRRFKFTYSAIEQSTPAELTVYYEVIQKDLERERKEQEAQNKAGSADMTGPPKNLRPD